MRRLRRARARGEKIRGRFRRRVLVTGTAAAVSVAGGAVMARAVVPLGDKHQIAVTADADGDLLADREELAIGYQPFQADQNRNTARDGAELAVQCAATINVCPPHIEKTEFAMYGLETCDVCGEAVNMGYVSIRNPRLGLEVEVPYIALHAMEHGSFSHAGELHKGRIDVPLLLRVLEQRFPVEANEHQLPLDYSTETTGQIAGDANDLDGDLLADREELAAGLNLYSADENGDLRPDGIELAQQCAEMIDRLPTFEPDAPDAKGTYKISFMMRGIEQCEICGESLNMGYFQIVNATSGSSMEVPVITLHYMAHGSFSYMGTVHTGGRVDIAALREILGLPARCGDLGTLYLPADLNRDCRVDFRDLAELTNQWLGGSTDPADG